ncbi:MAG: FKBP-type peptidyl-prolyl cis-trans isomerase [Bacteroidota bacterium]
MIKEFLSKRNLPFEETPEGIFYHMNNEGSGPQPQDGQYVQVHYTGKFLDGRKFDSSVDRDMPFVFKIGAQQVIPGWDQGLKLFSVGQSGTLYLPPELAYGAQGAGDAIPPNASLIFEIELLDILDEAGFAKHQEEERKRQEEMIREFIEKQMAIDLPLIQQWGRERGLILQRTDSGLHYTIEKQGQGGHATPGSNVSVHYTGKLLNGQVFDSSYSRQQPISFTLGAGQVIQGWDEGLTLLQEGGRGTLLIPSVLGYGPRDMGSIPPNSVLVFDVELVKVS